MTPKQIAKRTAGIVILGAVVALFFFGTVVVHGVKAAAIMWAACVLFVSLLALGLSWTVDP